MRRFLALLLVLLVAPVALARAPALQPGGTGVVREVIDGDTLVLADGRQVRLVGIQAPKLALGRPNFADWPLAAEARAELEKLALGKTLTLSFGGAREDRHGRVLAHLHDPAGLWLQGEMLRRGLARVYSFPDNVARVPDMLALEDAARRDRRGIWALAWYRVRPVTETPKSVGRFDLVEGRVLRVAKSNGRTYLNFGMDYRSDFTVAIPAASRRAFAARGPAPESLEGRRVRVRGWIKSLNGPMIEATHPEQIEVLPE